MQIYRSVLLNNGSNERPQSEASSGQQATFTSAPPPVSSEVDIEVGSRGDIIMFYNKVFIGFIKDFVLKFSTTEDNRDTVCALGSYCCTIK